MGGFIPWMSNRTRNCLDGERRNAHAAYRRHSLRNLNAKKQTFRPFADVLELRDTPAVLMVDVLSDGPISGLTPTLSLREAVSLINTLGAATDGSGNSLVAAKASQISGSFGSNDSIQFLPGLFGTQQQQIPLTQGELLLSKSVNITGPGANLLAASGNNATRVFNVLPGNTVTISGLTICNGESDAGAGVYADTANLSLVNCDVLNNHAAIVGGGVFLIGGTLGIIGGSINNNVSMHGGGVLVGYSSLGGRSTMTIRGTSFLNNEASTDAGGLYVSQTTAVVTDTTFAYNSAHATGSGVPGGGAIKVDRNDTFSILSMENCTFFGNQSDTDGGAIQNWVSTLSLINCTLTGNHAAGAGGGINMVGGTLSAWNSIMAQNTSVWGSDVNGTLSSGTYNLIGGNPMLAPLGDNGGPTQTMSLLPGSPALNAGDPNILAAPNFYDQRGVGYDRVRLGRIDIGAFEQQTYTTEFSGLNSPTIIAGTASVSVAGVIQAGSLIPTGSVYVSVNNGTPVAAAINPLTGAFSAELNTLALSAGTYTITYSYPGNATYAAKTGNGTLIVQSPQTAIQGLEGNIQSLSQLSPGIQTALIGSLDAANKSLQKGNVGAAKNQLGNAFLNKVDALHKSGRLTDAEWLGLVNEVNVILAVL